jgi:hypothetical protein
MYEMNAVNIPDHCTQTCWSIEYDSVATCGQRVVDTHIGFSFIHLWSSPSCPNTAVRNIVVTNSISKNWF